MHSWITLAALSRSTNSTMTPMSATRPSSRGRWSQAQTLVRYVEPVTSLLVDWSQPPEHLRRPHTLVATSHERARSSRREPDRLRRRPTPPKASLMVRVRADPGVRSSPMRAPEGHRDIERRFHRRRLLDIAPVARQHRLGFRRSGPRTAVLDTQHRPIHSPPAEHGHHQQGRAHLYER